MSQGMQTNIRIIADVNNCVRTVLSSAGNDGKIRLWKATSGGSIWRPAGSIGVEQAEPEEKEKEDRDMDMGS